MEILETLGINFKVLIGQIINFVVILYLLKRFAYQPFLKVLGKRKTKIEYGLKKSEEIKKRIQLIKLQREKILQNTRKKTFQILKQSEKRGKQLAEKIVHDAHRERKNIMNLAAKQGKKVVEAMQGNQKETTINLGFGLAQEILKQKIDFEKDKQIIEEFLLNLHSVGDIVSVGMQKNENKR